MADRKPPPTRGAAREDVERSACFFGVATVDVELEAELAACTEHRVELSASQRTGEPIQFSTCGVLRRLQVGCSAFIRSMYPVQKRRYSSPLGPTAADCVAVRTRFCQSLGLATT